MNFHFLFAIFFVLFFLQGQTNQDFDIEKIGKTLKEGGEKVKDLFSDKDKIADLAEGFKSHLNDFISKGNNFSQINSEFAKTQFMLMMLKALQGLVKDAKNQNRSSEFLNIENLASLFQMMQQYKELLNPTKKPATSEQSSSDGQGDLIKNLLSDLAKNGLDQLADSGEKHKGEEGLNETFMKNLLSQMMNAGKQGSKENTQQFSLKDLTNIIENVKEINNSIDKDQLKEMTNFFKEYLVGSEENNEQERFDNNGRSAKQDGPNVGLIVILTVLGMILTVGVLLIVRRYFKKRQFMTSRMFEHKPLSSMDEKL